jgi:hypothetical protein
LHEMIIIYKSHVILSFQEYLDAQHFGRENVLK